MLSRENSPSTKEKGLTRENSSGSAAPAKDKKEKPLPASPPAKPSEASPYEKDLRSELRALRALIDGGSSEEETMPKVRMALDPRPQLSTTSTSTPMRPSLSLACLTSGAKS